MAGYDQLLEGTREIASSSLVPMGINKLTALMLAMALLMSPVVGIANDTVHRNAQNTTEVLGLNSVVEKPEWHTLFASAGTTGTFVLCDLAGNHALACDTRRASTPMIPASTFKIFNSMAGLDAAAVRDENEVIKWDGIKRMEGWNQDHTMRSAFAASAVPFYQEIARRVGAQRMQSFLNDANYGNRNMDGGIDKFWLTGGLRISAVQQIDFLIRLYKGDLPFTKRAMDITKDIMVREQTTTFTLRGKTGWAFEINLGWFVGWIEREGKPYFFAMNMDMKSENDAEKRVAITKQMLKAEKLLD